MYKHKHNAYPHFLHDKCYNGAQLYLELTGWPALAIYKFQHSSTHTSSREFQELTDPEILMKILIR